MNEQLLLENIRGVLGRLEDTILFALIERAQFLRNAVVYRPGALGDSIGGNSLVGFLLRETESLHARMRRYTSPDEHPFCADLPSPILPRLRFDESPLQPNTVNINADIRRVYEETIVPLICKEGDDLQYGSTSVCDVSRLQSLSRRIHYGKFVAESKYRSAPGRYQPLISAGDAKGLMSAITDGAMEARVLDRVERKAIAYGRDLASDSDESKISPDVAVRIYRDCVIPLNKQVQVLYLLQREAS